MRWGVLLLLSLWPAAVCAAPTRDGPVSVKTETLSAASAQSQTTAAITVGSNANRLLMVRINYASNDATGAQMVNSVTFGGVALTMLDRQLHHSAVAQATEIWYLIAPATGSSSTVTIDLASTQTFSHCLSVVDAWYDVDQSVPFGSTTKTAAGGSFTSIGPLTITGALGDAAVDMMACFFAGVTTIDKGAGQTIDAEEENNNVLSSGASHELLPGSSVDLEWTMSVSVTSYRWLGVAMKRAGSSSASASTLLLRGCCE